MKLASVLAVLSLLPFSVYARLQGAGIGDGKPSKGGSKSITPGEKRTLITKEDLGPDEEIDEKRLLEILKKAWPECVRYHMTAMQCKEQVDHDIMTINTGVHTTIRSVIVFKREEHEAWYNSVAIQLDDNDHVLGRDNDGMVYYDFPWDGKGEEATKAAQRKIPLLELDPDTEEPVAVTGAALDDKIAGIDNRPIAGGRYNPYAMSAGEVMDRLDAALQKQKTIQARGLRHVGPWDCSGMSGVDCCLMIKSDVRDADMNDNAIQCYLDYKKGTEKAKEELTPRRVRIFANHLGMVSQVPRVG